MDGIIFDNIDLNEKMYYNKITISSKTKFEPNKYIVKNLKEDKNVYFTYQIEDGRYYKFRNPFVICYNNSICDSNITLYKFEKGQEYTIYINYTTEIDRKSHQELLFYYPAFIFFPILNDTIEDIKLGYYTLSEPKIFNLDTTNTYFLYIYIENPSKIFTCLQLEKANHTNVDKIRFTEWQNNEPIRITEHELYKNVIVMAIPFNNDKPIKLLVAYKMLTKYEEEIFIPAERNAMIFYNNITSDKNLQSNVLKEEDFREDEGENEEDEDEEGIINLSSVLTNFISPIKNMEYISSSASKEKRDFICQNYYSFPIYVHGYNQSVKLNMKTYQSRYAFLAAINNNLFKEYMTLLSQYTDLLKQYSSFDLFPLCLRINTDFNIFYEYVNLYFYETGHNVNIYFKKLYGATDLLECNPDSIDKRDLSVLTKPIAYCKDKQSILNRIYNFEGTKLITGYLDYNSVFDIYIELIIMIQTYNCPL